MNNFIRNENSTNFKVGDTITLTIDRLSYDGGRGVGRLDNFVFFVPKTAPNEKIQATITQIKKNYGEAQLVVTLEPSSSRRTPPCPVVNECGGCAWQHVSYSEQLEQKQGFIKYHLKKVLPAELEVPEIVPSENEFYYRNRVQIHAVKTNRSPNIEYGFFKTGTNSIVPIKECAISDPVLFHNLHLELLNKNLDAKPHKFELALDEKSERVIRDLIEVESEFTQVNSKQNENMCAYVIAEMAQHKLDKSHTPGKSNKIAKIYDLYCGSGNITAPLASQFPDVQVIGVEFSANAIKKAIALAKEKKTVNLQYYAQDVAAYLTKQNPSPNTIMSLDPARAGLGATTCQQILRLKPARIVYISCSLPSLARDLELLCKTDYEIVKIQGFDMFPQTEYVETVVTLLPRDI